jgi:hypothetical protein
LAGSYKVGGVILAASALWLDVIESEVVDGTTVNTGTISFEDLLFEHPFCISGSKGSEIELEIFGSVRFHIPGNRVGSDFER